MSTSVTRASSAEEPTIAHAMRVAKGRSARARAAAARNRPRPASSCRAARVCVSGNEKARYCCGTDVRRNGTIDSGGTPLALTMRRPSHEAAAHAAKSTAGTTLAPGHPPSASGRQSRSSHADRMLHASSSAVRAGSGASRAPAGRKATASVSPAAGRQSAIENTSAASSRVGAGSSGAAMAKPTRQARAAPMASRRTVRVGAEPCRLAPLRPVTARRHALHLLADLVPLVHGR